MAILLDVVMPGMDGFDFHREIRHFEEIVVEVYDNLLAHDDRFIKELQDVYKIHLDLAMAIDSVKHVYDIKSEVDERLTEHASMPGEGVPLMNTDMLDDIGCGALPSNKVCRRCGPLNPSGSTFCNECGTSLAACPKCGHLPEGKMPFCTKYRGPLD